MRQAIHNVSILACFFVCGGLDSDRNNGAWTVLHCELPGKYHAEYCSLLPSKRTSMEGGTNQRERRGERFGSGAWSGKNNKLLLCQQQCIHPDGCWY